MKLTEDTFDELYKPQQNHLDDNASWDGQMYETFGKELEYVLEFANHFEKQKRVWTILDVDGKMYVSAGYHIINRMGYFITENKWKDGTEEFEVEAREYDFPITDLITLDDFLLNSGEVNNDLSDAILEFLFGEPNFEFKRDENGLGFIVDVWYGDYDDEPTDTATFWFEDYED